MLKLYRLIFFAVVSILTNSALGQSEISNYPFHDNALGTGGSAKLLTPEKKLSFDKRALLVGGKGESPEFTFPGWDGQEGTVAYRIKGINWNGSGKRFVVFMRATKTVEGSFIVYKYGPVKGIFVLGSKKIPGRKDLLSFPIYDRKLLSNWRSGDWHHVAFTWLKGKFVKLYLDGKLVASGSGTFNGPEKFNGIALGPSKSGMGYNTQSLIKDVYLSPRPMTDTEVALLSNQSIVKNETSVVPFSSMKHPAKQDGIISPDEYPNQFTGLVDNSNFRLSSHPAKVFTGYDQDNLYIAASIKLPSGYNLQSASLTKNDPKLIAGKDIFALFLAKQHKQRLTGLYFTVAPNGVTFDAQEVVDWKRLFCNREVNVNYAIKSTSRVDKESWTVEIAIPKNRIVDSPVLSLGFKLGSKRLSFNPQLVWYDHYQGLSKIVYSDCGIKQKYKSPASGNIQGIIELLANSQQKADLALNITKPQVSRKSDGMVVDKAINERLSIKGTDTLWQKEQELNLKNGKKKTVHFEHQLFKPDVYLFQTKLSTADRVIFNRALMFDYFSTLSIGLSPVPSIEKIKVIYQCRLASEKLKNARLVLEFKRNNKIFLTREITSKLQSGQEELSMQKLAPGKYNVNAKLYSQTSKLLASGLYKFEKKSLENWRREKVGLAALNADWVPSPWTALKRKGSCISVWGREYDYGGEGIIRQIVSQGEKLLKSPVRIKYKLMGENKAREFSKYELKFKPQGKGRIEIIKKAADGNLKLETLQTLEFDGFSKITVKLRPQNALKLEKLWVEIPFKEMPYSQIKGDGFEFVGASKSAAYKSFPVIWFGDNQVNCSILAENCKGWWFDSRYPRLLLEHREGANTVKLMIVNQAGILKKTLDFSWIIQAGPTKALFDGWQDIRMMGGGWTPPPTNLFFVDPRIWSSSYSYPEPLNWPRLKSMVAFAHKRGQKVYPYLTPTTISSYDIVKRDTPVYTFPPYTFPASAIVNRRANSKPKDEYFYNAQDWNMVPHKVNSDGSGKETTELVCTDPDSSWADFFVYSIREMLTKSDVDGFYFDLPLPPMNYNPHKKLSYVTRDGASEGSMQFIATRNLYKRLYWIFEKHRTRARKPYLLGHNTRCVYPINSFVDVEFHGEAFKPRHPFEFTQWALQNEFTAAPLLPPAKKGTPRSYDAIAYRTYFGTNYGTPTMLLPQYGYVAELGKRKDLAREMLAWTFLHNTLLWPAYIKSSTVFDFWKKVNIPFSLKNAIFKGYWENGIKSSPECVRVSWYYNKKTNEYLLVIANFSKESVTAQITIPNAMKQLKYIANMETGKTLEKSGNILAIEIPAYDLRVIHLK
jgi:hypothetical protein